jgi:hypothetical protein
MSDINSTTNQNGKTVILSKNDEVLFTYPEGFNAVANTLQFLPEKERVPALIGLVMGWMQL